MPRKPMPVDIDTLPPSEAVVGIRVHATTLAATLCTDEPHDLAGMWTLCNFFERILMQGTEAVREDYAPKAAAVRHLGVVK